MIRKKNRSKLFKRRFSDKSLEETVYILSSPKNAQHVFVSLKELKEGNGTIRKLIEDQR